MAKKLDSQEVFLACTGNIKDYSDPIRAILRRYCVYPDAIWNSDGLQRNGVFVDDFELITDLTALGVKFNQRFINRLKKIDASRGSAKEYLEVLRKRAARFSRLVNLRRN